MKRKGFTLVELVAVVVILGLIILIAIPGINIGLKGSRRDSFKITCDKIYAIDEKYDLYQDLIGSERTCVTFDFDQNYILDQNDERIEPLSKVGLDNTENLTGRYKLCKGKNLNISNDEFTCVYDKNNERVLKKGTIEVPVLNGVEIDPSSNQISISVDATGADKYYYKIGNGKFVAEDVAQHVFTGLNEKTEYIISVYVEKTIAGEKEGLKSDTKTYKVTTIESYRGIPKKDYEEGEEIVYGGIRFLVVKDNGDTTTLITAENVQTNQKFGNTSSWADSSSKEYLNGTWKDANAIIKYDIEKGGLIYNDDSASYIRMIKREELNDNIGNYSNTPFWTMTSVGNDVYYALKNASKQYTKYSLSSNSQVTYYQGNSANIADITKTFTKNEAIETQVDGKAAPTSTSVQIGDTKSVSSSVTGKENYTTTEQVVNEDCNCVTEPTDCHNVACNQTAYSTQTVSGSYCQGLNCAGYSQSCTALREISTCAGYAPVTTNYCQAGCAQYKQYCASSNNSCRETYYSKGKVIGYGQEACCRYGSSCTKYNSTSCGQGGGGCTRSAWDRNECAGHTQVCTTSTCSKYITTSKSENTHTSIITSTCETCDSTKTTCQTCTTRTTIYQASGNSVTYKRYSVSQTTDVIGIRAVITVRENSSIIATD